MNAIVTLTSANRIEVKNHLLSLDTEDRYLRFFTPASDEFISRYVEKIDFTFDKVFGVYSGIQIIALVHLGVIDNSSAELGISIIPAHRGTGLARKLLERAVTYCTAIGIKNLFMSCLKENSKMKYLAIECGLKVITQPDEITAELQLNTSPLQTASVISQEILYEQISLIDTMYRYQFKNISLFLGSDKNENFISRY